MLKPADWSSGSFPEIFSEDGGFGGRDVPFKKVIIDSRDSSIVLLQLVHN